MLGLLKQFFVFMLAHLLLTPFDNAAHILTSFFITLKTAGNQ